MLIHMFNVKTGTSTEWIQFALPVISTAPISGYLICMDRAVLCIFWTLLVKKIHRLFNLSKRSDTWSQEKDQIQPNMAK